MLRWGCGLLALESPGPSLETEAGAGGGGARAGVAGGAELREAAPDTPTPARLSGAGQRKDWRLRGSRRCQCGGVREQLGAEWAEQREAEGAVAAAATPARVFSSSRCGRGRLLPPSLAPSLPPPSAAAPPPSAPRGFFQTSQGG